MPIVLLLSLLLQRFVQAQLPLDVGTILRQNITSQYRSFHEFSFFVRTPGHLTVDWLFDPRDQPTQTQGLPDVVLSASIGHQPPLPIDKTPENPLLVHYQCSEFNPCFINNQTTVTDAEAFFSHSNRSVVSLNVTHINTNLFVRIQNYPRKRHGFNNTELKPRMKGLITIRYMNATDAQANCPAWLATSTCVSDPFDVMISGSTEQMKRIRDPSCGQQCSGKGRCINSKCECNPPYDDRFCSSLIRPFPLLDASPTPTVPPLPRGARVVIKPSATLLYLWTQKSATSQLAIEFRIDTGMYNISRFKSFDLNESNSTRIIINVKSRGENGTSLLDPPALLPGPYDVLKQPQLYTPFGGNPKGLSITRTTDPISQNESVIIAITANATAIDPDLSPKDAVLFISATRCNGTDSDGKSLKACPSPPRSGFVLPLAVLPICIAAIGLTFLALFAMLWFDRRHGFTNSVDRLSPKELSRMYPAYKHHAPSPQSNHNHRAIDPDAVITNSVPPHSDCSICLSSFENLDSLRRLQCEHTFHADCIDPWVTQNSATCPTCRADCRIEQFSDKRQLRRVIIFFLAPVAYLRNLHQRRTATQMDEELVEVAAAEGNTDGEAGGTPTEERTTSVADNSPTFSLMPAYVQVRFPSDAQESADSSAASFISAIGQLSDEMVDQHAQPAAN